MSLKLLPVQKATLIAYAWIFFAAILYVFGIQSIMQVAKVLPSGVSAISSVITFLVPAATPFFGVLYLGLNLPLLLIFGRKMKRRFLYRTSAFILFYTALTGFFVIPELRYVFANLVLRIPDGVDINRKIIDDVWPKLVLPPLGGILIGFAVALAWKNGGSSGGIDIIVNHIALRLKRQVGTIGMIISLSVTLVSFAVFVGIDELQRQGWLTSIIGSSLYIVVSSLMINLTYPRYTKVLIEIHSERIHLIEREVRLLNQHSFRILTFRSGYSGKSLEYISTVMLLVESREFIRRMRQIDPKVWISVQRVINVVGNFDTKSVD